jgi:hypothetical protein
MITEILGYTPEVGAPLGNTGLTYRPSMDIHDASKIQSFMNSPRAYFFNHLVGWKREEPSIHLVFGSGWHEAMEHMLLSLNTDMGYSDRTVLTAFELFEKIYNKSFQNTFADEQHPAKNPANALQALVQYAAQWRSDTRKYKTLYTEIAGSVPVEEDRVLHFKLDSIMYDETKGTIFSMEHKTTGRKTQAWLDSWGLITQPWLYTHALRVLYEDEPSIAVKGVVINGAVLRKGSNEFTRIPVAKTNDMMAAGLWAANHQLDLIKWNMENLLESSPDNDVLAAFPCNGTSCSKFGCDYAQFCTSWANPLRRIQQVSPGFEQDYWDPRRQEDDASGIVHLADSKEITPVEQDEEMP